MSELRDDTARIRMAPGRTTGADPGAGHPAAEPGDPDPGVRPDRHAAPIELGVPRRRRRLALVGGAAALALAGLGAVAWRGGDDGGGDGAAADAAPTATAEVAVRDLEERTDLEGTLGYGEATQLTLAAQGTLTWLPADGTVVERGQAIAQVDDRVVPLLYGERPLWRELGPGVDDGPDVEQLEANLVALGVVTADELTVDQDWTAATTDAVQEWQGSLGLDDSGRVAPGDVVVQAGAVRVAGHVAEPGGQASGPVLDVAGTTRQVTIDLEATRQGLVQVDQPVDVQLPGGTTVTGTVAAIGTVAETPESADGDPMADQTPTIEVTVSLDDPAAAGSLDEAPVTVRVVTSAAQGVLAVPVDALLALAEGGYAVERVEPDGTTSLVAVEIGAFADGWVEVTGDLAEGDDVTVPA